MGESSVMKEIVEESRNETKTMMKTRRMMQADLKRLVRLGENSSSRTRGKAQTTTTTTRRRPFLSVSVTLSSLLFLFLLSASVFLPTVVSTIHINENGGYENIVVTIGKEVPPIACQQLIQNIQVSSVYFNTQLCH